MRYGSDVIPMGHRTYLKAKAGGDNSMFGKAGRTETVEVRAGRGPDGMVKPTLVEPQCPNCKQYRSDTTVDIRRPPEPWRTRSQEGTWGLLVSPRQHVPDGQGRSTTTPRARTGHLQPSYRPSRTEHGIAYGARALGQRSRRSSPRSGKPATWRRAAGELDRLSWRYV
jgi:hypothetical protein